MKVIAAEAGRAKGLCLVFVAATAYAVAGDMIVLITPNARTATRIPSAMAMYVDPAARCRRPLA